jgi:hypothetical protein
LQIENLSEHGIADNPDPIDKPAPLTTTISSSPMIAASLVNANMTADSQKSDPMEVDTKPISDDSAPSRRTSRRTRNALSGSLNLGSSMNSSATNSRRAQDAAMKSSFSSSIDRRAGLAATHSRLSQSFIDQSGEGLDDDTINEILKGFSDEKDDDDDEAREKGRGDGLASIESQKSMHFHVRDDSDSDDD